MGDSSFRWFIGFVVGVGLLFFIRDSSYEVTSLRNESRTMIMQGQSVAHKSAAHRCPPVDPKDATLEPLFQSQSGEDILLLKWFNGLCGGTYIEMGAVDGVKYSNSYYFNKNADWKGLLVELVPKNYEKLLVNRPNDLALVNAAVCGEPRTLHYVDSRAFTNGVWEFSSATFRERFWPGITFDQTKEIQCLPLQTIIEEHIGTTVYFDFFSLDIEGAEFEALQSLDFDKVGFGILLVESDLHNELKNLALREFLEQKGYTFIMAQSRSWWFANKDLGSIYRDILYPIQS